jgi:hypothetical protein
MSLIQDALKRQAEETAGARLPGQPIQPIQPIQPSEPPPPQQQQRKLPEKKKNKAFPIVPLILFLVVFLVALLVLSLYLIKPKPKLKTVPKVSQKSVPVEPVALPATSEPVKVLAAPVQAIEAIVAPVLLPVAEEEVIAEPVLKIKKTWPELKLTGIAQGGDRQRVAILNGKMLSAGRRLGEVAVIQVRDSTVVVEYRGERRTLYIGE